MCDLVEHVRRSTGVILHGALCLLLFVATGVSAAPGEIGEDGSVYTAESEITRSVYYPLTRASGPLPDVAIVASASGAITDPWFTDPRDILLASALFNSVTVINAGQDTPTVPDLMAFDAVLVWSNFAFADDELLGDNLSAYVDEGGGVVRAVFASSSDTAGRALGGRWVSHAYDIVPPASGNTTGSATLGTVHDAGHPVMVGVASFAGGTSSFRATTTTIISSASLIAEWSDGSTLVAVREDTIGSCIDLGFYPPSDAVLPGFWDATTDGDLLLVNALKYAADRPPLAPADSDGDGDVDNDDFTKFELCFTGAGAGPVLAGCAVFDLDGDDDIDCSDWYSIAPLWTAGAVPVPVACPALQAALGSRYIQIRPDSGNTDPVAFRIECGAVTEWLQLIQTNLDESGGVFVNIGAGVGDCAIADFLTPDQWTNSGANNLYVTGLAVTPNSKPTVTAVFLDCAGAEAPLTAPVAATWVYCDSSGDGQVTFFNDLFKQFANTPAGGGGAGFLGSDPGIEVDTQGNSPTVPDQQITLFSDIFQCFLATTAGGGATWTGETCP